MTDNDGGGRMRVGGMRAGAGGRCYHAPMLLGAGEVKLVFWALRWKEKGELSHAQKGNKQRRKMRGMKLSAMGEGA